MFCPTISSFCQCTIQKIPIFYRVAVEFNFIFIICSIFCHEIQFFSEPKVTKQIQKWFSYFSLLYCTKLCVFFLRFTHSFYSSFNNFVFEISKNTNVSYKIRSSNVMWHIRRNCDHRFICNEYANEKIACLSFVITKHIQISTQEYFLKWFCFRGHWIEMDFRFKFICCLWCASDWRKLQRTVQSDCISYAFHHNCVIR